MPRRRHVNMFRQIPLRFSLMPNCRLRAGNIIATQNIRRGERIRIPPPKVIYRNQEDKNEINRLADVSYRHAINN